jgi:hypothetical protein
LPEWVKQFEAQMLEEAGHIHQERREFLDRLLQVLVLIERADQLIVAEIARVQENFGWGQLADDGANQASLAAELDLSTLRKLLAYRRRFRAERDRCISKVKQHGKLKGPRA